MIKKTLGGDRLGSGNRMKVEMHNYERSTHDLGNVWRSSMTVGVLVPFYKKICTNGDTWTFNLKELVRTMPAIGPCFGSFKMQLDMFEVPIRLYHGLLHNNMVKIGMNMNEVKLPKIQLAHTWLNPEVYTTEKRQVATDSLVRYCGIKGIAGVKSMNKAEYIERQFQCVPILAYYDIFKNYYANKQEENAYVIDWDVSEENNEENPWLEMGRYIYDNLSMPHYEVIPTIQGEATLFEQVNYQTLRTTTSINNNENVEAWQIPVIRPNDTFVLKTDGHILIESVRFLIRWRMYNETTESWDIDEEHWEEITNTSIFKDYYMDNENNLIVEITDLSEETELLEIAAVAGLPSKNYKRKINLVKFKLENIDKMRMDLLKYTNFGSSLVVGDDIGFYQPYAANFHVKEDGNSGCYNSLAGLVVKTYQSDLFNNWLSKDWIDGVNGINEISSVAVENGKIKIDALSLAHKVYNMLNRIAVSGGTYEDWQEAVYGEDAIRRAESPIYCGGASGIITFEEIVSTADTDTAAAGDQPLGSMAGKGTLTNVEGGNIEIHIKEPSYIMGIVSITPLIDYSQGNDFDMTEIESLGDLHAPELDQIGFQDLMLERAVWWGTEYDYVTQEERTINRYSGGKTPAWIEYMTSYNEVHGDFADPKKLNYMVLTRNYEEGNGRANWSKTSLDSPDIQPILPIKDWTTYINPSKYNYMFANTKLDAQNFWVQIGINATARRKMSAKLIPNL